MRIDRVMRVCEREPPGLRTQSCIGGFCFNVVKTSGNKTYLLGVDSLTASDFQRSRSCEVGLSSDAKFATPAAAW